MCKGDCDSEDMKEGRGTAALPSARILLAVAPVVSDLPLKTPRGMDSKSRISSNVRAQVRCYGLILRQGCSQYTNQNATRMNGHTGR